MRTLSDKIEYSVQASGKECLQSGSSQGRYLVVVVVVVVVLG